MSTVTGFPLQYNEPRTIWTISLQLLYTILAMVPFYYYLTNLVQVPEEGAVLLQYLPVITGVLLFFIEIRLNDYYWNKEKIYKHRDIFVCGMKSVILIISMFYTIFFFVFGWLVGTNGGYDSQVFLQDVITRTMIQLIITFATIIVVMLMMETAQSDSQAGRKFSDRIRRN